MTPVDWLLSQVLPKPVFISFNRTWEDAVRTIIDVFTTETIRLFHFKACSWTELHLSQTGLVFYFQMKRFFFLVFFCLNNWCEAAKRAPPFVTRNKEKWQCCQWWLSPCQLIIPVVQTMTGGPCITNKRCVQVRGCSVDTDLYCVSTSSTRVSVALEVYTYKQTTCCFLCPVQSYGSFYQFFSFCWAFYLFIFCSKKLQSLKPEEKLHQV